MKFCSQELFFMTIETDERTNLYYRDWGTGNPILFVHSWAVNSDIWQYQMVHLADHGFRCIAFDRRGHGRSTDPGRGYNCDRLADDLAAVIEHLDLRDLTLVGHSLGCKEIVRYLGRHGSARIARVVMVAPTTPFILKTADNPEGIDGSIFDKIRTRLETDLPGWLAENARPFFVPETSQAMVDWGISLFYQTSLHALIDTNRANIETDLRSELPKINVPVLVIHGDKDMSAPLPLTGKKTAALIPGSRLVVYEGAPHGMMFTHTARLNADLLAFIA
jgi:non-heme chloroperoxidase